MLLDYVLAAAATLSSSFSFALLMSLSTFLHSFIWATFVSGDGRNFDMLYAFYLLLIASAMLLLNHSDCFVPFGVIFL